MRRLWRWLVGPPDPCVLCAERSAENQRLAAENRTLLDRLMMLTDSRAAIAASRLEREEARAKIAAVDTIPGAPPGQAAAAPARRPHGKLRLPPGIQTALGLGVASLDQMREDVQRHDFLKARGVPPPAEV